MAERFGKPLMPWQLEVAMVGGEIDAASGLPAYRDVVVTVPRQSGKTTLILAWEIQRALGWGRPQQIVYTAQDGSAARKKLLNDQAPILEPLKSKLGIRRILKGAGNEAVEFRNGSRIGLLASGDDSGHGQTLDLAVKDEFWKDYDDRRDQALGPAMITRADAQKLTASTMGTDASVPLNHLVTRGREAVESGQRQGIAYFEWSADPAADPDDPKTWWACMPALGITMTEDAVRHERDVTFAGKPGEFRRAYLNIATTNDERLIPAATWDLVNQPGAAPSGRVVMGVDVGEDRLAAAIVAVGDGVVEVVEHRPQLGWLMETVLQIDKAQNHPTWAVDGSGPAGSFADEMVRANLNVVVLGPKDVVRASGSFFDAVVDRQITVRRHPSLDAAVAGAASKASGDAWAFTRRSSSVDISPLMAAAVALRLASGDVESVYEERGLVGL